MGYRPRLLALLVIAGLALGGCAGSGAPARTPATQAQLPSAAATAPSTPAPTGIAAGCGSPPDTSRGEVIERDLMVGGATRSYRLGLPPDYDGKTPLQLLVALHGADESAAILAAMTGLEADAWAHGFVTALPDARSGVWTFDDSSDLEFVERLIDGLGQELCLDEGRTFLTGFSQGGDFSSFVACHLPGRASAVAVVGVMNAYEPCRGWEPTPLLAMAGSADPIYVIGQGLSDSVPFSGRPEDKPGPLAGEIEIWGRANGCQPDPVETAGPGAGTTFDLDCPAGAAVTYLVHQGGHTWPSALTLTPPFLGPAVTDIDANALIIAFFEGTAT